MLRNSREDYAHCQRIAELVKAELGDTAECEAILEGTAANPNAGVSVYVPHTHIRLTTGIAGEPMADGDEDWSMLTDRTDSAGELTGEVVKCVSTGLSRRHASAEDVARAIVNAL